MTSISNLIIDASSATGFDGTVGPLESLARGASSIHYLDDWNVSKEMLLWINLRRDVVQMDPYPAFSTSRALVNFRVTFFLNGSDSIPRYNFDKLVGRIPPSLETLTVYFEGKDPYRVAEDQACQFCFDLIGLLPASSALSSVENLSDQRALPQFPAHIEDKLKRKGIELVKPKPCVQSGIRT